MSGKRDPADLLSKIFDRTYPLNNHTVSVILGGSGSGKSYFCYNILTKIYLDNFDVFHLLICSKTARCDKTLSDALQDLEREYPYLQIDLIGIGELAEKCQEIRANSLKSEYLNKLCQIRSHKEMVKYIDREIEEKMKTMSQFPRIQEELYLMIDDLRLLLDPESYRIEAINTPKGMVAPERLETLDKDERRTIFSDPEKFDINYVVNFQGLGINHQVFSTYETKPQIVIDYHNRELSEREYLDQVYRGIMRYLVRDILLQRRAQLVFGNSYQPILAIVDDNVGDAELIRPHSALTQLIYLRRHLHTSLFILSQSATGINTNIRRNTNSFHLLPSISNADLKLINDRLPAQLGIRDIKDRYLENTENEDRNQRMTSLFCVAPYNCVVDGAPPCVEEYYAKICDSSK